MGDRKILLFQDKHSNDNIARLLSEHQWHVQTASELTPAIKLLKKNHYLTGLIYLETCNNKSILDQLEELFNHSDCTNWVIALPKECLKDHEKFTKERMLTCRYCFDFLSLPVDEERLLFALGHAYGMAEISISPYQRESDFPGRTGIIGESACMAKLFQQIIKVSQQDDAVLIQGETGTGKELIAQAIHKDSRRKDHPLIAINCGAFPKDLIQAELFGYEKGAFTGAQQRKIGKIEAAQGGTLFLDEIGDLPLTQQVNLLRFLEEKAIERIGSLDKIPVDVRIVAATHIDLQTAVSQGKFREDLYYRLRVLQLDVPPLRARENDIELLAWYFFKKFSSPGSQCAKGFSAAALYTIRQHLWPGNVRELSNCIRQAIVMSDNRLLTPADLGLERRDKERLLTTLEEARQMADCDSILNSLRYSNYNMTKAAEILGISRVTLYRLIEKYQLNDYELRA